MHKTTTSFISGAQQKKKLTNATEKQVTFTKMYESLQSSLE
jgi:hypothetical protein